MQIDKREKQSDINVTIIFLADWEQKANKSNTKKIVKRLCTHTHTHKHTHTHTHTHTIYIYYDCDQHGDQRDYDCDQHGDQRR